MVVGMGLVAPRRVGSSRLRDCTRVPDIGRQILYHGATKEALTFIFVCVLGTLEAAEPSFYSCCLLYLVFFCHLVKLPSLAKSPL